MKLSHRYAILISGLLWLGIGILLLTRGIQYLVLAGNQVLEGAYSGFSLIQMLSSWSKDPEQGALILLLIGLILGFFKGRIVMKKSVNQVVERIRSYPSPIRLSQMYSKKYLILIGSMSFIGIFFKILPLPLDIKGFCDLTIGVALVNGAMLYARAASFN